MLDDLAVDRPNEMPIGTSFKENSRVPSEAIRLSQPSAVIRPPAYAWPLMAATVGGGQAKRGPPPWGPHHALKGLPPGRVPGGLARDRRSWRPGAHDGERCRTQQELRDAVDHHAPLTVGAILTDGTIDAAARVDLDVRGGEQQLGR